MTRYRTAVSKWSVVPCAMSMAASLIATFGAGPAQAKEPMPARPIGNPGEWVTTRDYPMQEVAEGRTGITEFRLAIGPDGLASDCVIATSSGSVVLDATACALIKARARFEAARDAEGQKTTGTYSNRVRWVLPEDQGIPLSEASELWAVELDIDEAGTIERCRTSSTGAAEAEVVAKAKEAVACAPYPIGSKTSVYVDNAGKAVKVRVNMTQAVDVVAR